MTRVLQILAGAVILISPQVMGTNEAKADTGLVDINRDMVGIMMVCQTDSELDCIQGVSVVDSDGSLTQLTPINGEPDFIFGSTHLHAYVELESPSHMIYQGRVGSAMRVWISGLQPADRARIHIDVRTSWLRAEDIQLLADEAIYTERNIPGGTLWSFEGSQQTVGGYDSNWAYKIASAANADFETQRLVFFVHHAGLDSQHSYFDPRCVKYGYPVRVFNAPSAGLPYWDQSNRSLNFGIDSPHASPLGVPYVGYFKLWVPTAYIDCMYPTNNITNAVQIQVIIKDESGEQDVADTTIKRANGLITVVANNFHYSAPVISIKAVEQKQLSTPTPFPYYSDTPSSLPSPSSTVEPAPGKTTITCLKGKLIKKLTAVKPKCPAGYKKK